MKWKTRLFFLIDLLLVVAFASLVVYFTNRGGYLPLGGDGFSHATKMKFLTDFWPKVHWVYFWGNGIPVFLWYGYFPYLPMTLFYLLFASAAWAITATNWLIFVLIGVGIYGIVRETTESRVASLLAAFLTLPLPGLWYRILVGTTTRTLGDGFLILSVWFLIRALKQERKGGLRMPTFLGLALFTGLAFQTHFFTMLLTGFFTFFVILFVAQNWRERIRFFLITYLPAFLLAAYFLVPYLLTGAAGGASSTWGFYAADPLKLDLLWRHPPEALIVAGGGLLPIHLPLLLLLTPIAFLMGKLKKQPLAKKVLLAFLFLFVFFMLYGTAIYFGYPATWYNIGFVPDECFEFLSLIIPVLLGILLWLIFSKAALRLMSGILFLILLGLLYWQYPFQNPFQEKAYGDANPYTQGSLKPEYVWEWLAKNEEEKNYRYAHPSTEISLWFNYDSQIPQNREFFPHGVMNPNWRSWQENAIWNEEWSERMAETKFLLDWFAIRWFSLVPPSFNLNQDRYLKDKDFEKQLADRTDEELGGFYSFEYQEAAPILSATNAPTVLVIGERKEDRSYGPLVRLLGKANLNSQAIIPVRGKSVLDDYKKEELALFPLVVLYEYHLDSPQRAASTLLGYLKQGGKVIIESSSFLSENERQVFERALGFASEPFEAEGGDWQFSPTKIDLTARIDFDLFSPPTFEGAPWKFRGVNPAGLDEESESVLINQGQVVILRKKIGQGELIWSGLKLAYHAVSKENQEEANFFLKMIFNLLGADAKGLKRPESQMVFVNPQERKLILQEPAQGVLFKENYFANWHGRLKQDGKSKKLKIYPGGLDFMYLPLDQAGVTGEVELEYRRSPLEWFSGLVSLFSLIGLLVLVLVYQKRGHEKFQEHSSRWQKKSVGRLGHWWDKDDE